MAERSYSGGGKKKSNQYISGVAQINPKYFLNTQIKELGPYQDRKFSTYMRFLRISREMVSPGHPLLGIPHYLSLSSSFCPTHSSMAIATPSFPQVLICNRFGWRYKESWGGAMERTTVQPRSGSDDGHAAVARFLGSDYRRRAMTTSIALSSGHFALSHQFPQLLSSKFWALSPHRACRNF